MLKNLWGLYPWFESHDIDKVHPDDLGKIKEEQSNTKVYECIDEDDQYITIRYGDKTFRVKDVSFKQVPAPKFDFGEEVKLVSKDEVGIILDILWHFDKEEHYYFIMVDGKRKSKRYFESDFEFKNA